MARLRPADRQEGSADRAQTKGRAGCPARPRNSSLYSEDYCLVASEAAAAASEAAPEAAAAASVAAAAAPAAASDEAAIASPAASEAATAASVAVSAASEAASAASVVSEPFEQAERPRTAAAAAAARTILRMYGILEQRVDQARHKAGPKAYCNSRLRASINQLGASMQASSHLGRCSAAGWNQGPSRRLCRGCDRGGVMPA